MAIDSRERWRILTFVCAGPSEEESEPDSMQSGDEIEADELRDQDLEHAPMRSEHEGQLSEAERQDQQEYASGNNE